MHREYKRRKIIIFSLIGILLLMAVGYSAFQTKLNITSTSNITSVWDVEITSVQTKEINGLAENVYDPTYTKLEANMEANFYEPGDYITYIVTVSNLGTLDATLDSIKLNMPQEDVINFKVEGATSKEKLKVGEHKDIEVTMEYTGNNPDNISSVEMDVNLDYVQDGNSTNFSDADSPVVDNLRINDIILTPTETSVKAEIEAENAIKYYFSIDNNEWYESTSNIYNIYHLKPNTTYTMYVKAEGSNGDVVYSSKPFTTLDNTSPEINIKVGDNVKGENDWYKGLSLNIEVTDNDKVKEVLYCTEKDCTPDETLNLEDNKTTITFESKSDIQEVCIKATDMKGNVSNKCSDEYKVDGTEPTISNMNINTLDDTMTIELEANDNESGLNKYYFSKDGGKTYIESNNPNYTFTSLDEGDYLVTAYIKDTAGNTSEIQAKSTAIRYTSYCKKNGIDNFGECLIATEAQNPNIDEAKSFIESKGTPDFTKISPSIVYEHSFDQIVTDHHYIYAYLYRSYSFNAETGKYTTSDPVPVSDVYKNGIGNNKYYVIIENLNNILLEVTKVEKYNDNTWNLSGNQYIGKVKSYDASAVGMYADNDNDGRTYYYRGSVSGNYVKFAGFYWRVIRVNGDGTVRLIYDGKNPHANGESSSDRQISMSAFNKLKQDNTYVGYMYSNNGTISEDNNNTSIRNSGNTKYYFSTEFTFDDVSKLKTLKGDIIQTTMSDYASNYSNNKKYIYVCTSYKKECEDLYRINDILDTRDGVTGRFIRYSSTSYDMARDNSKSSTIKESLDKWYNNNLQEYTDIISNKATFCNDRTVASGDGYGQSYSKYSFTERSSANVPTLICPQKNDNFSVSNENGNNKLIYPIGLITADEAYMAGGKEGYNNLLYYLNINNDFYTMTPESYNNLYANSASEYMIDMYGQIYRTTEVTRSKGVRPVINLDPDKITFTGNGTMQDPYVIS